MCASQVAMVAAFDKHWCFFLKLNGDDIFPDKIHEWIQLVLKKKKEKIIILPTCDSSKFPTKINNTTFNIT